MALSASFYVCGFEPCDTGSKFLPTVIADRPVEFVVERSMFLRRFIAAACAFDSVFSLHINLANHSLLPTPKLDRFLLSRARRYGVADLVCSAAAGVLQRAPCRSTFHIGFAQAVRLLCSTTYTIPVRRIQGIPIRAPPQNQSIHPTRMLRLLACSCLFLRVADLRVSQEGCSWH